MSKANVSVDKVGILMAENREEDGEKVTEKAYEVIVDVMTVEEVAVHMKMELIPQMSPFTFNRKSGTQYQNKQKE